MYHNMFGVDSLRKNFMGTDSKSRFSTIFLVGPPGVGKSRLGEKACQSLGLRFFDLSTQAVSEQSTTCQKEIVTEAITTPCPSADIVAIPWAFQRDKALLTWLRCSGVLLLLWAHPLDMQARSGHSEPLFTPSLRIKTRCGFGRNGTGSLEFRSLNRAVDEVLLLVDCSFNESVRDLQQYIACMRKKSIESPMIRTGLSFWVDDWRQYGIGHDSATIIVDAMARYLLHLRSVGKSPRTLSGVSSDLQAAGILVSMYDCPKQKKKSELFELFSYPPWTIEFSRKFSDSPNSITRYETNLEGFARFLGALGVAASQVAKMELIG